MSGPDARSTVLVVEDEDTYLDALNVGLTVEGFDVVGASTITEARGSWPTSKPDLVLLDVMLPDGSGIDFCREVYDSTRVPVIMVTRAHQRGRRRARSGDRRGRLRDQALPAARAGRAHARRAAPPARPPSDDDSITFGDLRIDFVRRTVTRRGVEIELSRKEFDLLALFASRLDQVVTREVCLDTLWWGLELSDTRTLDTHVKRLRQKIEDDPAHPRHLITIRGVGFRLDP